MKRNPTCLEVVALALVDEQGRILMQKRRAERQHGGLWEFPGGKVEAGESKACALVREIEEELGVVLDSGRIDWLADAADPQGALVISLYTCREWSGEPHCIDAAAIGWFAPAALDALAMPPLDRPLAATLQQWLRKG